MADNDTDDLFDDSTDDDSAGSDGSSTDAAARDGDAGSGDDSSGSKRIDDLMSKWQKEQAKAARLEAELARLRGTQGADTRKGGDRKTGGTSDSDSWADFHRQMVRERLYESEPRLKAYDIPLDAISGSTPEEMKASFKAQIALVDKIETKARNAALLEHGLVPEVGGGAGTGEPMDFDKMSTEEFDKFLRGLPR